MIETAADRRIVAMIGVFHHPDDVAGLADREIHLETAHPFEEKLHVAE